jgi:hypothetical protein
MSNYNKATNFATKDTLPSGNPLKIVRGVEIDTEFNSIATAILSKSDSISPTFTGTATFVDLTAVGTATFTTLSASSTVSGAGFSNYLASPPAIGGTAPAAGSFTSVTTPSVTNAGSLELTATGANIITASTNGTQRMQIDAAGTVTVGDSVRNVEVSSAGTVAITTGSSERFRVDSSGNFSTNAGAQPAYFCRAWVNFDGTLASPGVGRGSSNVSSVVKNGTGDYTVNFSTAMADAGYATNVTSATNTGANAGFYGGIYPNGLYSTTQVQVAVFQSAVDFFDTNFVCVAVFR